MRLKGRLVVAVCAATLLGGCSAMISKPDTPKEEITLALIEQVAVIGCSELGKRAPHDAIDVRRIINEQVLPVVDARISGVLVATAQLHNEKEWEAYVGTALNMSKLMAIQQGWLDTDTMYYVAVGKALRGCVAGIDAVVPVG